MDYAYDISNSLIAGGYECFIDQLSSLTPDKNVPKDIITTIKRSKAFVLVGSKGAHDSAAMQKEIAVFLEFRKKNAPIIVLNIDGAIDEKAVWYINIIGLPEIDVQRQDFLSGKASEQVLERIKKTLFFTKKGKQLRVTFISTLVLMGIGALAAGIFTTTEAKAAGRAANQAKKADTLRIVAEQRLATANRAKDSADSLVVAAQQQRAAIRRASDSLQVVLHTTLAESRVLEKRNRIQNLSYQAKLIADNDPNQAFRLARQALQIEKELPGSAISRFLFADLLNGHTPRSINDTLMNFAHQAYGSDRDSFTNELTLFDIDAEHTQMVVNTYERKLDEKKRIRSGWGYAPVWLLKEFIIGILDIKGDSLKKLQKNESTYLRRDTVDGYLFDYSPVTGRYYFITDEDTGASSALKLFEVDDRLQVIASRWLPTEAGALLQTLGNASAASDFTYIHSLEATDSSLTLHLIHPGDTSVFYDISLDSQRLSSSPPAKIGLPHFPAADAVRESETALQNMRDTKDGVFFIARDTLYTISKITGRQTILCVFRNTSNQPGYTSPKQNYIVAGDLVLAADSANHLTVAQLRDKEWEVVGGVNLDRNILDIVEVNRKDRTVLLSGSDGYRLVPLEELLAAAERNEPRFNIGSDKYFDPDGRNYHLDPDGNLVLISNDDPGSGVQLHQGQFTRSKYTPSTRIVTSVDERSNAPVLATDLSNLMLPQRITDDAGFDTARFRQIPLFSLDSTIVLTYGDHRLIANRGGFVIRANGQVRYRFTPEPGTFISLIQFMDDPGLIFFISTDDELNDNLIANVLDIRSGSRLRFDIKTFLEMAGQYQITGKYIYFSETQYIDHIPDRKMIRIVNPAISYGDLTRILDASIY